MSIARAFTMRKRKNTPPSSPPALPSSLPASPKDGAVAVTHSGTVVDRSKISKPIELISTTNMLSYNAPDVAVIRKLRQPSSTSSSSSASSSHESEGSTRARSSVELTDASSVEESPSPITPGHNHLSCFFDAARKEESASKDSPTLGQNLRRSRSISSFDYKTVSEATFKAPAIPRRAPSHSKSAHLKLARKRSLQSLSSQHSPSFNAMQTPASTRSMYSASGNLSRASSLRTQRTSGDFVRPDMDDHPFGKELQQLNEVVEEFDSTVRDAEAQEDEAALKEHGLLKWTADEYLSELIPLYTNHASTVVPPMSSLNSPAWI